MKKSTLMNLGLALLAVLVGLGLSVRPWKVYFDERDRTAQYKSQMRNAENRRIDLIKEKARLEMPMGREEAARNMGFTKPDEKPVETP